MNICFRGPEFSEDASRTSELKLETEHDAACVAHAALTLNAESVAGSAMSKLSQDERPAIMSGSCSPTTLESLGELQCRSI